MMRKWSLAELAKRATLEVEVVKVEGQEERRALVRVPIEE
jgi:hypothetical protein